MFTNTAHAHTHRQSGVALNVTRRTILTDYCRLLWEVHDRGTRNNAHHSRGETPTRLGIRQYSCQSSGGNLPVRTFGRLDSRRGMGARNNYRNRCTVRAQTHYQMHRGARNWVPNPATGRRRRSRIQPHTTVITRWWRHESSHPDQRTAVIPRGDNTGGFFSQLEHVGGGACVLGGVAQRGGEYQLDGHDPSGSSWGEGVGVSGRREHGKPASRRVRVYRIYRHVRAERQRTGTSDHHSPVVVRGSSKWPLSPDSARRSDWTSRRDQVTDDDHTRRVKVVAA